MFGESLETHERVSGKIQTVVAVVFEGIRVRLVVYALAQRAEQCRSEAIIVISLHENVDDGQKSEAASQGAVSSEGSWWYVWPVLIDLVEERRENSYQRWIR